MGYNVFDMDTKKNMSAGGGSAYGGKKYFLSFFIFLMVVILLPIKFSLAQDKPAAAPDPIYISFIVFDSTTGAPIDGFIVTLYNSEFRSSKNSLREKPIFSVLPGDYAYIYAYIIDADGYDSFSGKESFSASREVVVKLNPIPVEVAAPAPTAPSESTVAPTATTETPITAIKLFNRVTKFISGAFAGAVERIAQPATINTTDNTKIFDVGSRFGLNTNGTGAKAGVSAVQTLDCANISISKQLREPGLSKAKKAKMRSLVFVCARGLGGSVATGPTSGETGTKTATIIVEKVCLGMNATSRATLSATTDTKFSFVGIGPTGLNSTKKEFGVACGASVKTEIKENLLGVYTLLEELASPKNFIFSGANCTGSRKSAITDLKSSSIKFEIALGETITCTFSSTYLGDTTGSTTPEAGSTGATAVPTPTSTTR